MAKQCKRSGGCNSHAMQHQVIHQSDSNGCPTINMSEIDPNTVEKNVPFSSVINFSAGTTPHSIGLVSGAFPPSMTVFEHSGIWFFAGTCPTAGVYEFTLGGLDAEGCHINNRTYTFTVTEPAPPMCVETFILDADHLDQKVGVKNPTNFGGPLSESLSTGNVNGASLLSIVAGTIPTGMIFTRNGTYWQVGGTPTAAGTFTFTIGGTDGAGCPVNEREFTIIVAP
jgi:hypothetical protein